ncbi:hypothetical protein TSA6c_16820 [Azospirillum sp. TSA6c]|uniref:hypothetical protein n=1 Tax=Azospirillum sp. TSA6c TaxID=709813 RepID=UPI000D60C919|nr:hypothetical protein [Azospirillum sp. TSA6c]PWC48102.1 hypothetical protein TSA6c_16820 [Azospirillum sp. TSA6c]
MIDLSKLTTKELVVLFNQLSSGTITRFESHTVGVDRITKLVARMQADQTTVLKAMKAAGLEFPPGCDLSEADMTDIPAGPETTLAPSDPVTVPPAVAIPQEEEAQAGAASEMGEAPSAVAVTGGEGSETEVSTAPKEELNENDRRVLGFMKAIGPCKFGAVRDRWKKEDGGFARLAPTQQKGMIRRSVRKLEGAAMISKEGMIFTVRAS